MKTLPLLLSAWIAAGTATTAQAQRALPLPIGFDPVAVEHPQHGAHGAHGAHGGYGDRHRHGGPSGRDEWRYDQREARHDRGRAPAPSCACRCGSGDRIRLVAGYQRGKPNRPRGWHPRSWFEHRGYDLRNYAHEHERTGEVHHGSRLRRR